jgi:c-di-GMP-binding flagellar brake protein YcgR
VTTHILHRAEVLTVAAGDDGEIEISFRSRDDRSRIETIGLPATDAGMLMEAVGMVRDGRSKRVTIREDGGER